MTITVRKLPRWFPVGGVTIGHTIWLKYPEDPASISHERVHVLQQERYGWRFWFLYLFALPAFWNPWRLRWEAAAYAESVRCGLPVDLAVRFLASWRYLWVCSEARARDRVLTKGAENLIE